MDSHNDSDSSSDEGQEVDTQPLKVDWMNLSSYECTANLGITSLPGCRFKDTWRNLKVDIDYLASLGVCEVFVLCTKGELSKYRVSKLFSIMKNTGLKVHHFPFPDGQTPSIGTMLKLLEDLRTCLKEGHKTLIHCYGGLGRSSLVCGCLLLQLDPELSPDDVMEHMKSIRGPHAVQSIKQFNFLNEFREKSMAFTMSREDS